MASYGWEYTDQGNNVKKLSHPLHANSLLSALNESRKIPELCDGIVVVGSQEIPVQRNVLAAASPYFRALYTYDSQNVSPGAGPSRAVLKMGEVNGEVLEQILDYIYTSVITLSEENIQDILQAADILLMADLKEVCCEYLEQCISVNNCLGIWQFAERFACPRVYHAATNFMDEHFCEVSYTEEFLQLPVEQVKPILQRTSLLVQTEDAIFDCAVRWVRHDVAARQCYLENLLISCVHLGLLDERYLQEFVIADELIRQCELEATILRLHREDLQPKPRGFTNMIVVTGGEGPTTENSAVVEIKNSVRCVALHSGSEPKPCPWLDLSPMSQPRIGHGLVEAGGYLYAIGGRDNNGRILNTGERYDPTTDTWSPIEPMFHARVGFGLVTIDDRIYAIGGSNDMSDPLTSIEEYSIYKNKWRPLPDMNLKRAWSAYAVAKKKIYVIAGGILGKLYEAAECFDPRSETWSSVAPMKERRFDARAIGLGDNIYVFGGLRRLECPSAMHSGTGMKFCGTEVYSTEHKIWETQRRDLGMCTMTETSHIDSVALYKDEIIVVGDLDAGGMYNCVRAYCPATNTWRGVTKNHPSSQRGMQACMLKIANSVIVNHRRNQQNPIPECTSSFMPTKVD